MHTKEDETYMRAALEQARLAASTGDIPVGAVVVHEGQVIATGCNRREADLDPTAHAEIVAMREAARALGRWRLSGCTVYVTLEPCVMCAGAMVLSRISRCVVGALDPSAGALDSIYAMCDDPRLNHSFPVSFGVLEKECSELLDGFFSGLRRTCAEECTKSTTGGDVESFAEFLDEIFPTPGLGNGFDDFGGGIPR